MKWLALSAILLTACGTLERRAAQIYPGMSAEQVRRLLGSPQDRQFSGNEEVWQFCKTGAGFGYHDYRAVWFRDGKVTGVNSYKSGRPASSCARDIKPVRWEDAPDKVIEIRSR